MESITGLLKLLNKPALLYWANKIGLEGTNIRDYQKKSSKDGIDMHKQVQDFLLHGVDFCESDKLLKCINSYEILGVEQNVDNGYINGRYDLMLGKNSKKFIVDFKSSEKIYLEQKIQLSAYKELTESDGIAIINFTDWKLIELNIDSKKYFDILRHLYSIKQILNELNERC